MCCFDTYMNLELVIKIKRKEIIFKEKHKRKVQKSARCLIWLNTEQWIVMIRYKEKVDEDIGKAEYFFYRVGVKDGQDDLYFLPTFSL